MRAALLLLLAIWTTPAAAQHQEHAPMATSAPATACAPEHAAMGHCTPPTPAVQRAPPSAPQLACTPEHAAMGHCKLPTPVPAPAPQPSCTPEHAAMGHCKLQTPTSPPVPATEKQATCLPEHAAMGHCALSVPVTAQTDEADLHAGHDMGQASGPEVPVGPPPPQALSGPKHAADTAWDRAAMDRGRNILREEHGGLPAYKLLVDRAETRMREGRDGYLLDAQAWYGGDIDKLWLKSEVEGRWGEKIEHAEVQALWSHAIDPWFDLQTGVRFDPQPGPNRSHLVLGVQGLAPYWGEVDGAVFLSNKGDLTARVEAEYDLRITQTLILQPRAEIELAAQDIPELGVGAGLSEAALGLRLRYQVSPLVAPYIGLEYDRAFGETGDFRRAAGEGRGGFNLLGGIRCWF